MKWLEANKLEKLTLAREADYPQMAMSLTTTLVNKTGSWRIFRPIYLDKMPPCNDACPAFEKIQGYMELVKQKRFAEGYNLILEDNPFPSITGRVCYHPCESACNRKEYDEPLGIQGVERFLGDYGLKKFKYKKPKTENKKGKIAIVGSGPAGLTAAYYLQEKGYSVTIFEHFPLPGGMLRYGIPEYRLPKTVLNQEIKKVESLGVKIKTNQTLGKDFSLDDLRREYNAVLLAIGAHKSRRLGIPGDSHKWVIQGLDFLRRVNNGIRPRIGKDVLVIGGGNTAIDAARCARRIGASVRILYRRTRPEMPAISEEVEAALKEGVSIEYLIAPVSLKKVKKVKLECVRMRLGEPDESGRRKPIPIKNSNFYIDCDSVITAIGEAVDLSCLESSQLPITDGETVSADEWGRTSIEALFSAGDCVTGPLTVVEAIGQGKRVSMAIDAFLSKTDLPIWKKEAELAKFANLNADYFEKEARRKNPELELAQRKRNFQEVYKGYDEKLVVSEAARCFSCGVCNKCDNCFVFCPDLSVLKTQKGYEFDYDFCKGCGVCAQECPRYAISMIEEER